MIKNLKIIVSVCFTVEFNFFCCFWFYQLFYPSRALVLDQVSIFFSIVISDSFDVLQVEEEEELQNMSVQVLRLMCSQ